jgi:aspartokinase
LASTPEIVKRIIDADAAISSSLGRKLINTRALARYIQDLAAADGVRLSFYAVMSAIRRYQLPERIVIERNVREYFARKKLTLKTNVADIALQNNPDVPPALGKLSSQIDYSKGETLHIAGGVETIRIVLDEKNLDRMKGIIPEHNVKEIIRNLAEIIVSLDPESLHVAGTFSTVTSELAMSGINMIEAMSCAPDIIVVVNERDAVRAYQAMERLGKNDRFYG